MESQVTPKSLIEVVRYFSDADICIEFIASLRWLDGVTCPHCKSKNVGFLKNRRIWNAVDAANSFL